MTTQVQLPDYFQQAGNEYWYSVGDRVYGTISVNGSIVKYRFNDGSRPYSDERAFDSESKALRFAARFAAEMRKSDKRNCVPTSDSFRRF